MEERTNTEIGEEQEGLKSFEKLTEMAHLLQNRDTGM
jgi:hypothetical protein